MKATGIVRKIRDLGRIVIPSEMRDNLELKLEDSVEFFVEGERIIMQKYVPGCIFCGNTESLTFFENKKVCSCCIKRIKNITT